MGDAVRVMSRIKSLMRSRGMPVSGTAVYSATGRAEWMTRLPEAARPAVELLYLESFFSGLPGVYGRTGSLTGIGT